MKQTSALLLVPTAVLLVATGCSGDDNTGDPTGAGGNAQGAGGEGTAGTMSAGGNDGGGGSGTGAAGGGGGTAAEPSSYTLSYGSLLGGNGWERAQGIHVANDGSVFLGGNTSSTDFPVTPGAFQTTKLGPTGNAGNSQTGYVVKFDSTGQNIQWATYIGGSRRDQVYTVRTDLAGNVYAVGGTGSDDFPTTAGAYDETFNGPLQFNGLMDVFVAKFDPNGQLLFSTFVGGATPGEENPRAAIEIDEQRGRIYVAGLTKATDFPTTPGSFQPNYGGGGEDGFVFALSIDGSTLEAATYIGGSGLDMAFTEIEQHPDGSLYIGGWTTSNDFPATAGAFQENLAGGRDGWVARISPDLDQLVYATYLGGDGEDAVNHNQGLAIDPNGRAVVIGTTDSSNFPTTVGAFQESGAGDTDAFITVLSEDGSDLALSTLYGGDAFDYPGGVSVTPTGQVAFTGMTRSANFPMANAFQSTFAGGPQSSDAILVVLRSDFTAPVFSSFFGAAGTVSDGERGRGSWVGPDGSIWFSGTVDSDAYPTTSDAYQSTWGGGTADAMFMRVVPVFD